MSAHNRSLLSALLAVSLFPLPALAKPAAPKPARTPPLVAASTSGHATKVVSIEGITQYKLPNGLRVLLFPDPASAVITVNLTYLVGSRHEGYGETGMAHLLEHLMFKGSKKHKNIPQELSEHGARPNGTTWLDRTNYYETFQASDANLEWALALESDRMVNSFIAKKDLDSEMTVVRNEYESGENEPTTILSERLTETAYLWHNYAHPTIGARSDIEKVPIRRLQDFYQRYYQPDNALLVVAGKLDEAKTLRLVEKHFGPIPRPKRDLIATYTEEPVQDGERQVILRRLGDVQAVMISHHIPPGSHADFAAIDVLGLILADSPSGRLYKTLVEPGKAVSVGGGAYQLREPGFTVFSATLNKQGKLQEATDILVKTVEEFGQTPPSAEEVKRAQTSLLKHLELTLNSSERLALQLSEWEALGDWRHFFLYRDRVQQVKPEDVQRVAKAYLLQSNRTVAQFVPTLQPVRAEIPWVKDPTEAVRSYRGKPPVVAGEAFDPSCKNCDARDQRKVLPGGLKLSTFEKKTRGRTVHLDLNFHLGSLDTLKKTSPAGDAVASILQRGTTKHTRAQLSDEFDRLKASVGFESSPTSIAVSLETDHDNLPAVLRLVAEVLRQPSFDVKEFDTWKQQVVASAEEERSDPESLAPIELNRHLDPYPAGDPRYVETIEEQIASWKSLTLDQVKAFYQKFYGASVGEVSVVGDFDRAVIEKILVESFSDWKSPTPYQRLVTPHFEVPPLERTLLVKDKANAVLRGGMNLQIRDDEPDYPALMMANYILGGGFLNSRLATRIRQKEGLSYGVGSGLSAGSIDRVGTFAVYAICAPQNIDKVEKGIKEELARALKDGFSAEELEKAKSGFLQSRAGGRSKNSALAGRLLSYQYLDRRFTWDEDYEKKIKALTPKQLVAALRRHVAVEKMSFVRAGNIK